MPTSKWPMTKPKLYPLKFTPILKSPLWGGTKLGSQLNKDMSGLDICGESWEISGVEGNVSIVNNGALKGQNLRDLIDEFQGALTGPACYEKYGNKFPLLIKFIDANKDLSIQVHPNDELAMARHGSFGKTEMWYVIDADEGASLISGFNKPTNKKEYLEYFEANKLPELLNKEAVFADDVFYLPAGRVHTIGKGLLIAEIQQTSDITYRIYDFDRVDKEGNKRELHVEEALEAIDYGYYEEYKTRYDHSAAETELVASDYFVTNRLIIDTQITRDYHQANSFKIIMILDGEGKLKTVSGDYPYTIGDTYLIPANLNVLEIESTRNTKLLEVYLPA
jgi:mannose-6-phosphate isomerase